MIMLFRSVLLAALLSSASAKAQTIFLVRHAEKMETHDPADRDPELSDTGRARAETLARVLKDAAISAIYATEFKRTQETAASLARAVGVKVTIVPAKETAALIQKIKSETGNTLVVEHSNTIPEILKSLGLPVDFEIGESDYDNLFVIEPSNPPRLVRLHY